MKPLLVFLATIPLATFLNAQWLDYKTPGIPRTKDGKPNLAAPAPRTPEGHPDLTGVWNRVSPRYDRNIAADLKPGEVQPWAQALVQRRMEDLGKDWMGVRCLPLGPAYSTSERMMKLIQAPALIVMLHEDLTYRQIYLDGRPLETAPNPSWMAYSVGRWDGDTLVVESFGFNDRTWLDPAGHPHTEALRTTERYRRRDFGNLDIEVTLADPGAYAKPWTVALRAQLSPDNELLEAVCNESNRSLEHLVGKASDDQKSEVKLAPEVLAKYVGTYVEQPKLWRSVPRIVEITLSDGVLYGEIDGRGKQQQFAMSETKFSGVSGLAIDFVKNGPGEVTQLFVKHVSGDYRFQRKR